MFTSEATVASYQRIRAFPAVRFVAKRFMLQQNNNKLSEGTNRNLPARTALAAYNF